MWKVLLKKWKGLSIKQKAVIIGIATLIAFFPVIFIVILIGVMLFIIRKNKKQ